MSYGISFSRLGGGSRSWHRKAEELSELSIPTGRTPSSGLLATRQGLPPSPVLLRREGFSEISSWQTWQEDHDEQSHPNLKARADVNLKLQVDLKNGKKSFNNPLQTSFHMSIHKLRGVPELHLSCPLVPSSKINTPHV